MSTAILDLILKLYQGIKDIKSFILPMPQANSKPSWFGFLMTLKDDVGFDRNELVMFLEKNNIQTRNLFAGNILRHPLFEKMVEKRDYRKVGELVNTDKIMHDSFWIGVYPGIDNSAIDYIIEKLHVFMRDRA